MVFCYVDNWRVVIYCDGIKVGIYRSILYRFIGIFINYEKL